MDQKHQPAIGNLQKTHGFRRVHGKALHVRMKLDALEAQIQQMGNVPGHIGAVGVQGAEGQALAVAFPGAACQKFIDMLHLMGDGGRRTEQGLGDTRRLLVRQHLVKGAMQRGDLRAPVDMVKPGDGFRRTLCDGGGVDMAVKIQNSHFQLPSFYKRFRISVRYCHIRAVEAIFSFSRLVWISCICGPKETQSRPGSFSLRMPHSSPAWIATTSGSRPNISRKISTIRTRRVESFLYSQAG